MKLSNAEIDELHRMYTRLRVHYSMKEMCELTGLSDTSLYKVKHRRIQHHSVTRTAIRRLYFNKFPDDNFIKQ